MLTRIFSFSLFLSDSAGGIRRRSFVFLAPSVIPARRVLRNLWQIRQLIIWTEIQYLLSHRISPIIKKPGVFLRLFCFSLVSVFILWSWLLLFLHKISKNKRDKHRFEGNWWKYCIHVRKIGKNLFVMAGFWKIKNSSFWSCYLLFYNTLSVLKIDRMFFIKLEERFFLRLQVGFYWDWSARSAAVDVGMV